MDLRAISVSRDQKWVVCGTANGASAWDAELRENLEFAGECVCIQSALRQAAPGFPQGLTGIKRTSGASSRSGRDWLAHSNMAVPVMSQYGSKISLDAADSDVSPLSTTTATRRPSRGSSTLTMVTSSSPSRIDSEYLPTARLLPIATWSTHDQRLFQEVAVSMDDKIKSFDSSTGSPLVEWQSHESSDD